MTQKRYMSIVRHGKSGTHHTIEGNPNIVILEKLDGANASFKRVDGEIICFSRNNQLGEGNTLRGFSNWVKENVNIEDLIEGYIYFGEWLVRHKLDYGENEGKFYLFDVYSEVDEKYLNFHAVYSFASDLSIPLVPVFYDGEFQSLDHIKSFVGKSVLGAIGEGVVVKNYDYEYQGSQIFTKFVSDEFAELKAVPKHKVLNKVDSVEEFVEKTASKARVSKLIHKLVDEGLLKEDYSIEDMGLILKGLSSKVYEDAIEEELDELLMVIRKRFNRKVPSVVKEVLAEEGRA